VLLEVLLSVAVIVVIMWLARMANLGSEPPRDAPGSAGQAGPPGTAHEQTRQPPEAEDNPVDPIQTGHR
jgi:hypothetical protein